MIDAFLKGQGEVVVENAVKNAHGQFSQVYED